MMGVLSSHLTIVFLVVGSNPIQKFSIILSFPFGLYRACAMEVLMK